MRVVGKAVKDRWRQATPWHHRGVGRPPTGSENNLARRSPCSARPVLPLGPGRPAHRGPGSGSTEPRAVSRLRPRRCPLSRPGRRRPLYGPSPSPSAGAAARDTRRAQTWPARPAESRRSCPLQPPRRARGCPAPPTRCRTPCAARRCMRTRSGSPSRAACAAGWQTSRGRARTGTARRLRRRVRLSGARQAQHAPVISGRSSIAGVLRPAGDWR